MTLQRIQNFNIIAPINNAAGWDQIYHVLVNVASKFPSRLHQIHVHISQILCTLKQRQHTHSSVSIHHSAAVAACCYSLPQSATAAR